MRYSMAEFIDIRELRRHEVADAMAFGQPLGVDVEADTVRWLSSLSAKRDGEWVGVTLYTADPAGTPRVWIAVDPQAADRDALIDRLIDKAMFKLASSAAGACAVVVCGDEADAVAARAFTHDASAPEPTAEAAEVRPLDEVLRDPPSMTSDGRESPRGPAQAA